MKRTEFLSLLAVSSLIGFQNVVMAEQSDIPNHLKNINPNTVNWKEKDDTYWKSVLSEDAFAVCRAHGTERPFTGKYCQTKASGDYFCYCCGQKLFSGGTKFDSGTGWPSFSDAALTGVLIEKVDLTFGMKRVEVLCSRCNAHLGHVFDDGPPPSGKRYCINSVCLYKD